MTPPSNADSSRALLSAQAVLKHIRRLAEAAEADHITPGEAVEQILDELAARPALGGMSEAPSRSFAPARPN